MCKMTRQHFQFIADTIKEATANADRKPINDIDRRSILVAKTQRKKMTQAFVNKLGSTNPNFRAGQFAEACGVNLEDIEGIN